MPVNFSYFIVIKCVAYSLTRVLSSHSQPSTIAEYIFWMNFSTWLFFFVIVAVVDVICLFASTKRIQIHRVHAYSFSSIPLWFCLFISYIHIGLSFFFSFFHFFSSWDLSNAIFDINLTFSVIWAQLPATLSDDCACLIVWCGGTLNVMRWKVIVLWESIAVAWCACLGIYAYVFALHAAAHQWHQLLESRNKQAVMNDNINAPFLPFFARTLNQKWHARNCGAYLNENERQKKEREHK